MLKGTVVGPFGIVGETAGRKLAAFYMIADTLAAYTLTGTRFVAAIARLEILFFHAFHGALLYCNCLVLLNHSI